MRRPLAEGEHGLVDPVPDVCKREEPLHAGNVAATHGVAERLEVAFVEIRHKLRPRFEPCFPGHGKLGTGKRQRPRRTGDVGAN